MKKKGKTIKRERKKERKKYYIGSEKIQKLINKEKKRKKEKCE